MQAKRKKIPTPKSKDFMNHRRLYWIFFTFILAALLAAGGCKQGGTPQAGNQQTNEYGQPTGPASSMPGVQTQPSAQPGYPESTGAEQAPGAPGAAPGGGYQAQQPPAGAAPAPAVMELPAGTRLEVRLNNDLGSKISQPGESFNATVTQDVVVDGARVIPRGARAEGKVIDAKPLGHFKGGARLALRLQEVNTTAGSYPITTSTVERFLKGKGKRSAGLIGGGAGLGALIGGVTGGGKGAAIGAGVGAGAGTVGAAATGNKQIVMPAGTVLTFKLQRSVRLGG